MQVEQLENRTLPATLTSASNVLTYQAGAGINNNLAVTISGSNFVFNDTAETITTSIAGATGSGTNTVNVPFASITGLALNLGDGADTIASGGINAPTLARTVTAAAWASSVVTVTTSAAHNLTVGQSVVIAGMTPSGYNGTFTVASVPTTTTFTYALASNPGTATAFGTATGPANLAVSIDQTGSSLTVSGSIVVNGNVTINTANALSVGGNILAGAGTISLNANTDGAGTDQFSQTGGLISTINSTANAIKLTVNTSGGGTGDATLDNVYAGVSTTGGTLTVAANGGDIVYAGGTALTTAQQGTVNAGSAPARTLAARTYVLTSAGGIGSNARPLQFNDSAANSTLNATAGTGGVFITDWGANQISVSLAKADAGDIRVVTANGSGHNLVISGTVFTGSGNIYLAADDTITVNSGAMIGGTNTLTSTGASASFSGTVWMEANRDRGTAGQTFTMSANSSIITTNTTNTAVPVTSLRTPTQQAVYLDISGDAGATPSVLTVGNITTGDGGRIVVNAIPYANLSSGAETDAGKIVMAGASNVLNAGATGTVELVGRISDTAVADAIGTTASPIKVTAGSVVTHSNYGNVNVSDSVAGAFTSTMVFNTDGATGQTGAPTINFTTTAGALTVGSAIGDVNNGAINLTGAGGVVLNAAVGNATTGAISINGALSGGGNLQAASGGVSITQATNSTYSGAISGSGGLSKAGIGVLTLTGSSGIAGTISLGGGTLYDDGALSGATSLSVATNTIFAGTGSTTAATNVSGKVSPGDAGGTGILNTGALTFGSGGVLAVDLNSTTVQTGYDQLRVIGAIDLTNAGLQINAGAGLHIGDTFTIIKNVTGGAVNSQFTAGATISAQGYNFTIDYANGPTNDVVLTITGISPLLIDVVNNQVSYLSAVSVNSGLTITNASNTYTFTDTAGPIALTANAVSAGWTVTGGVASGPSTGVTGVTLNLSDGNDSLAAVDVGSAALTINGSGTLTAAGTVTTTGMLTVNHVNVTDNASLSGSAGVTIGGASPLTLTGTGSITSTGGNIAVNPSANLTVGGGLTFSSGATGGTVTFSTTSVATMSLGGFSIANGALLISTATTLNLTGTISTSGAATINGVVDVTATATQNLAASTLTLTASNSLGTSTNNLHTQVGTIVAAVGAGGMFITQAGSANFTGTATGAGVINVSDTGAGATLTIAGTTSTASGALTISAAGGVATNAAVTSTSGNVSISAGGAFADNANINSGSGTITLRANTAGSGTAGFTQGSSATIATTNTTANAATILVNTTSGGTGDAVLGAVNVGSAAGGTLTVNSNGGDILTSLASVTTSQQGIVNGGSAPTPVLTAVNYVLTATGAGSIGTDAIPIQTTNLGTDAVVGASNFTLNGGDGGVYLTDWGGIDLTIAGASATGAGNIRIVTANSGGHNLYVNGNVSAGSGTIYLAADDNLEVHGTNTVIGGPGFSGTVWLQGNRDLGTGGQPVLFDATTSIVTSNTTNQDIALSARTPTTQAVYIDIGGGTTTAPGILQAANITVGDGGRIVLNGSSQQSATQSGTITMASAANVINVGPTGTLELDAILSSTTVVANIGTAATPIQVAGGNVVINSQYGSVFVNGSATTTYSATMTTIGGQNGAPSINLGTTAGQTIIGAALGNLNGGTITLASSGTGAGVVLNASLGSATTGVLTINGPLSGAGNIVEGSGAVGITQATNSTYSGTITGNQGVTIGGAGKLTFTGASNYTGPTQVNGQLFVDNPGVISSASTVGTGGTLGGSGTVGAITANAGAVAPGDGIGVLTASSANLSSGGNLTMQVAGFATAGTDYDQLALGAGALILGGTSVLTLDLAGLTTSGTAVNAIVFGSITGTFAQVVTVNNPNGFVPVLRYGANGIDIVITAAATHFVVTASPGSVVAGNNVNLTVTALDAFNNVALTYGGIVHFTSSDLQAVLPADVGLTNGTGTFSATMKTAGSQTIAATDTTASTITGISNAVTVTPAALDHFGVTGTPATTTAGASFNFNVTALDVYGNTVTTYAGTPTFTSTDTNPQTVLPPGTLALTNGVGAFSATLAQIGTQTITAHDGATTGVSANIVVSPAAASHFVISGTPTGPVAAGTTFSFTVTAQDDFGNTVAGYAGTVSFTSTDAKSSTNIPAPATLTNGVGTFQATLTTAGTQTLTASDSSISGTSAGITITPIALDHFSLTGAPSSISAGTSFDVTVTALDVYGNTVPSFGSDVTLTTTDTGTNTVVPTSTTLTAGIGTFTATLSTVGTQSITAISGAITGTTGAIHVTPAPLDHFVITGTPASAGAGAAFAFSVTAQDVFGNTVTGFNGLVHFTSSDTNAATSLPADITLSAGVGSFSAALTTAGSQTISVNADTIVGTSDTILVTPGTLHHFAVTDTPTTIAAGTSFSFTVTAIDLYGNTVTGYGGAIALTTTDTNAGVNLPAGGNLVNGVLQFTANLAGVGNQRITATAGAITGVSDVIAVTPDVLDHFVVTGMPTSVTAGTAFSFTVTADDRFGNTVTGFAGLVSFTSTDTNSQTTLPASTPLTSGVGHFTATLDQAGSQTITASSGSATGVSDSIQVTPASLHHFAVSDTPGTSAAGTPFGFTVTAQDVFCNTVTGFAGLVHFTSSDLSAALPVDSTLSNGVGAFNATLDTAGTQTITAGSGVIVGTSNSIVITPLGLDHFTVTGTPISTIAGNSISFTVTAFDVFGNVAVGYSGTVHFTSSDNAAGLPGDATLTDGVGTFNATLQTAGVQTVSASDGAISATSANILVNPASATHFTVSAPNSTTAGTVFNFTVTALDDFGNTATGYSGIIHFTSTDASMQVLLPANLGLTNGVGTLSATLATVGNQTITATDVNQSSIVGVSGAIGVNHAAADHFIVSAPANTTAGTSISITVTAYDPYGNIDTDFADFVHFTSTDSNSQTLLPANATLSNGMGSFSVTLAGAGNQTVTATDASNGSITGVSGTIAVQAASASQFIVSAPISAVAGGSVSLTVTARDRFGNVATGYAGTLTFTSSDPHASLPADSTLSAGFGTFAGVLKTAGSRTISATDTTDGTLTGTSGNVNVSAANASRFAITGAPSTAIAGVGVGFTITAYDAFDNVAIGYGGTVHFTSSDAHAVLPADTTLTNGVASLNATFQTAGSQTISAADGAIAGASSAINVQAATATHFTVTATSTTTAGDTFIVNVTARDDFENVATGYSNSAALTSSDAKAMLPSTVSLTNGVGSFVAVLKTAANQTITATQGTRTGTTGLISVTPAAARSFTVSAPTTTPSGSPILATVTALDAYGNAATGYAGTVHFTSSDTLAALPADATLSLGVGTFSFTMQRPGTQTISAADTGDSTINGSATITVANAASVLGHFAVSAPTSINAGTALSFTVTALDQFGDTFLNYSGTVSFTSSDGNAAFPITSSTLTNGVGTFTVTLQTAGAQTINAVAPGIPTSIGTASVNVQPLTATHFRVVGPPTAVAGTSFSFTVTALDQYDNVATGYTGAVVFSSTDNSAVLPLASALTSGVGTFNGTFKTAGSQTITATDANLSTRLGTSGATTVSAAGVHHFALTAPTGVTVGQAFSLTVTAQDAFNNVVTNYVGSAHFTSSDSMATLSADFPFSSTDGGMHTFTNGFVVRSAGSQTITVSDGTRSNQTTIAVSKADTTVSLSGVLGVVTPGVSTFTASIAGVNGAGTPTSGNVTLSINDGTKVTVLVASVGTDGRAVFNTTLLPGAYTLSATFAGNANFNDSTSSSFAYSVPQRGTTTTLGVAAVNSVTTFTATVTPLASGFGVPTGSVVFYINGVAASGNMPLSGGQATFSTSTLTTGTYVVMAAYAGSDNFIASVGGATLSLNNGARLSSSTATLSTTTSAAPFVAFPNGSSLSMPFSQQTLAIPFVAGAANNSTVTLAAQVSVVSSSGITPSFSVTIDTINNLLLVHNNSTAGHFIATLQVTLTGQSSVGTTQATAQVDVTDQAPTISAIQPQTTPKNTATTVNFSISDAVTAAANLIVSVSSDNQTLIPNGNLVVSGSAGSRSLTITPVADQVGTATITITVQNAAGGVRSVTFNILVNSTVTLPFSDSFTRNDNGFLGAGWNEVVGDYTLSANQGAGTASFNMATLNGVTAPDVSLSANVAIGAGAFPYFGLVARQSGFGTANFYWGVLAKAGGVLYAQIQRYVNGVGQTLVSNAITGNTTGGVLSFVVVGSSLKLMLNTDVVAVANDGVLTSGAVGIASSSGATLSSFNAVAVSTGSASLPFTDALTLSTGTLLSNSWRDLAGAFSGNSTGVTGRTSDNFSTLNGVTQADVNVSANVTLGVGTFNYVGLIARQSSANTFYWGVLARSGSTVFAQIQRFSNGVFSLLANVNLGNVSGGVLQFQVVDTSLKMVLGTDVIAVANDYSPLGAGSVGMRASSNASLNTFGAAAITSTTASLTFSDSLALSKGALLSSPWRDYAGAFSGASAGTAVTGFASDNLSTLSGVSQSDVTVSANVALGAGASNFAGLVARQTSVNTLYWGVLARGNGTVYAQIQRYSNGVYSLLANVNIGNVSGGLLQFQVVGTSLRMLLGSNVIAVANDYNPLAAGSVGMRASAGTSLDTFNAAAVVSTNASLPFTDNLTLGSGTLLSNSWHDYAGTFSGNGAGVTGRGADNFSTLNGVAQPDVSVSANVALGTGTSNYAGLVARQSSANTYYWGVLAQAGSTVFAQIQRFSNGAFSLLANVNIGNVSGGALQFLVVGTSLKMVLGTNVIATANDFAPLAAGSVGMHASAGSSLDHFNATAVATSTTSLSFTDNLNLSTGTLLSSPWGDYAGAFSGNGAAAVGRAADNFSTLNGVTNSDVTVSANVSLGSGASNYVGLIARQSSSNTFYWGVLAQGGGTVYAQIQRFSNGAYSLLANVNLGSGITGGALQFLVVGSSLKMVLGTNVIAVANDSTPLAAGSVGMRASAGTSLDTFNAALAPSANATLPFTDNLTLSTGALLSSSWSDYAGVFSGNGAGVSGRAADNFSVLNGIAQSDVAVSANVALGSGTSNYVGLIARQSSSSTFYWGVLAQGGGSVYAQIQRYSNGVYSLLANVNLGSGVTGGALQFLVVGTSLKMVLGNNVIAVANDYTPLAAGSVGMRASTGPSLDTFNAAAVAHATNSFPFSDNLTLSTGTLLSNSWRDYAGAFSGSNTGVTGRAADNFSIVDGVSQTDVTVSANVSLGSGTSNYVGLIARQSSSNTFYWGVLAQGGGAVYAQIQRYSNGAYSLLANVNLGNNVTGGALQFLAVGTSLKMMLGTTVIASADDYSPLAAGSVGMRASAGTTLNAFSASTVASTTASLPFTDPLTSTLLGSAWHDYAGAFNGGSTGVVARALDNFSTLNGVSKSDITVSADVSLGTGVSSYVGLIARQTSINTFYWGVLARANGRLYAQIQCYQNGVYTLLASVEVANNPSGGTLQFSAIGNTLTMTLDGVMVASASNGQLTSGSVGMRASAGTTLANFHAA